MTDELGFIQRNEIIWYQNDAEFPIPSDKFAIDYQKVYFFTKNKTYYFQQIFEEKKESSMLRYKYKRFGENNKAKQNKYSIQGENFPQGEINSSKRNKRCVWGISTNIELERLIVESGCPKNGIVFDPFKIITNND